jgi:hypothetical protein
LDAGGNHGLQKVRQVMQEVRHWMLSLTMGCRRRYIGCWREPWVAEGETGVVGGETLDAGGNHGLQKVRQVVQEVSHWLLE